MKLIIIYMIGAFFYYLSLRPIKGPKLTCFKKRNLACFTILSRLVIASSSIITFSIYMILYNKIYSKYHLINIIIIYSNFIYKDHNNEIQKHGLFNFIGFIIFTILFFLILLTIKFIKNLFQKSKYIIAFLFLSIFLFFIIIFKIYQKNHFFCNNWEKGLNNTYIDNYSKDYPCKINIPKNNTCIMAEVGHYFDFSALYRPTCNEEKLILSQIKYFSKSLNKFNISYFNFSKKNFFGYPLTNNDNYNYNICGTLVFPGLKNLQNELHNNIILMDLYLKNKTFYYKNESDPEILVILEKKKNNTLKIKVRKNRTLIAERKKISDKLKRERMFKNVLVIFFDTISRAHFFRKFPKTIHFLEQFTKYEKNYKKKKMTIFQFLKYHSVNTFTNPNLKAAYFGATFDGNGTHFANYFKDNGYIIGRASTLCEKINIHSSSPLNYVIWDHESISIPCIIGAYNNRMTKKLSSIIRRCLFGKDIFKHSLKYLESFWTAYLKNNKLFLFDSGDGHEPTGQTVGYLDEIFYNFLFKFHRKKWFNDTAIFVLSDHGQHLIVPLKLFHPYDIQYELTLPFLFIFLPNKQYLYKNNLYEIIKENQQVFITPFDIYDTLIHIAYGKKNITNLNLSAPLGNSLFTELNYKERFCDSNKFNSQIVVCNCKNVND